MRSARPSPIPLVERRLIRNDFQPIIGHRRSFRATQLPYWNGATDCEVLVVAPNRRLAYGWNVSGAEATRLLRGRTNTATWRRWTIPAELEQRTCGPGEND